ncbi:hypothetical protein B0T18DRAFT_420132 [Schizothecium vesticola]|uniref:Uncharacterized protein n=1 Tax=Schizothecium vesticola TaxID=314040 RepID=A0AA40EL94_9PEZI|nr:hypothetical protein B0T18DRAFT_420132 [Schizothecium vesticola]
MLATISRLVLASALFYLQLVIFVVELLGIRWNNLFSTNPTKTRWKFGSNTPQRRRQTTIFRQFIAPLILGVFAAVSIGVAFSKSRTVDRPDANIAPSSVDRDPFGNFTQCDDSSYGPQQVDADIAGDGIRIAIWTQIGFLIFIAILGTFHCKATGAKELGAGLAATHFSLAVALLVQYGRGTLTPADAIIGAMILDAQNSALLIQLATKETLAARWQVGIIAACQLTGLAVIAFFVAAFGGGPATADTYPPPSPDCRQCLRVFWWAFLRSKACSGVTDDGQRTGYIEKVVFGVYYACRCLSSVQAIFSAFINTQHFHLAEKENRPLNAITFPHLAAYRDRVRLGGDPETASLQSPSNTPSDVPRDDQERGEVTARVSERSYTDGPLDGPVGRRIHFAGYPSTVTVMYCSYGVFALASMVAAELSMRDNDLRPSSGIFSVGQIIGIVVAGATSVRAAWLFLRMFFDTGKNGFKFLWPFSFDYLGALYSPSFIVYPTWRDSQPSFPEYRDGPPWNHNELRLGDVLTFNRAEGHVSVSRLQNLNGIPGVDKLMFSDSIPDALARAYEIGDFPMDILEVRYLFPDSQDIVDRLLSDSAELAFRLPEALIPQNQRKRNSKFIVTGLMLARRPRTNAGAWPSSTNAQSTVLFAYQLRAVHRRNGDMVDLHIVYDEAKIAEWNVRYYREGGRVGEAQEAPLDPRVRSDRLVMSGAL